MGGDRLNIFIICTVRKASEEYKLNLERYVDRLERFGNFVHLPHRDTDQSRTGIEICERNRLAILGADEVHIFYNSESQGTHFDMGVAFAYRKKIRIIENEIYAEGKSFARMLTEWSDK